MAPRLRHPRLALETLERRVAPAGLFVTNLNDSGTGSLRQAISDSNVIPGADIIFFQPGVTGTIFTGSTLGISDSVTIFGPGAGVISVSGFGEKQPFFISNGQATRINVSIIDLTVTQGFAGFSGAGIGIANENVFLNRVVVSGCLALASGGGISAGAGSILTLRDSTISGNRAFAGVSSDTRRGGGIYMPAGGTLDMQGCSLVGNYANGAIGGGGGGIYFAGPVGSNYSGVKISNCTIAGNSAPSGGAISFGNLNTAANPVVIQNSTITGNVSTTTSTAAGFGGGGISVVTSGSPTITIRSNVLSGNTASSTNGRSDISTSVALGINNCAIGDIDGVQYAAGSNANLVGQALGLGSLADNGGPTQSIAFAANSPLRNAGSNVGGLGVDQRGTAFPRETGGIADIGAWESSIEVTSLNDSGPGSLRQAILDANTTTAADRITLQSGLAGVITLQSPLSIATSMVIAGPGAGAFSVSGNNLVRPFTIDNASALIDVTLSGLTVTGGRSTAFGAGIFTSNESVTLDRVVVSGNTAVGASGGGIGVANGGTLIVRNSTVSGNAAGGRGGGIYFFSAGSLLLENSTVSGNTAADANGGGGIYFFGTVASGDFTIRNSTIANNTAPSGGGLAFRTLTTGTGLVRIQNSTFTGNTATTAATDAGQGGGGIALTTANAAAISIVSTVVSGNTATNGRGDIAIPTSATVNVNFSAIGDSDGFTRSGSSGNNLADGTFLGLGTLANNGGPTQTISFASNSLLVNTGSNPQLLNYDQRGVGFTRVRDGFADIGAFELQPGGGPAPRVASVAANAGQSNPTQRSRVTSVTVTFNAVVTFAGNVADAFAVSRTGGSVVGGFAATANVVGGVTVVTLTGFTGAETQFGSLADGRYRVLVRANQVSANGVQLDGDGNGTGGDDFVLDGTVANGLYRLYGDGNADGVINAADFGQFRSAFGTAVGNPLYRDFLDVNGDGVINALDFGQFRNRFGAFVP